MTAAAEPDPLPRRFGRYLLFDKIGEGGMARIYLSRTETDLGGERLVVVKQILPLLSSSTEFSALLIDEAKLAARLSQANVVRVFDLGREGDALYITMEYVEGFDLRELLRLCSKTKTPLPIEFSLHIVRETLRGLDYAHKKKDDQNRPLGIVHRDVSPSNVLVSFDGEVKLCDFGIARAIGVGTDIAPETIEGKAGYMSPETASATAIDARSDVFSAGVILWELLNGRRMYRGENGKPPSLAQAIAAEIPPPTSRDYPEEARLFAIISKALAKDPNDRYASADAFLSELEAYSAEAGLIASALKFGQWLTDNFSADILELRRARQVASKALERGPAVEISAKPPAVAPATKTTDDVTTKKHPPSADDAASKPSWRVAAVLLIVAVGLGGLWLLGHAP